MTYDRRRTRTQAPRGGNSAILYTRVSTDEQADRGYSLRAQEATLRDHCARHGLEVVAHYQDDASAKTFDRPAWKKLEAHVRTAPPALVLFTKWDRFSRNSTDALQVIRDLRERHGVEPCAVEQPLDLSVPENRLMLAFYVTSPEVENERRGLNTVIGMRRAQQEGRWTTTPPFGYRRERDERDKSILVPDDREAPLVREAFEMAATTGLSLEDIRRTLRPRGMRLSTNQFNQMLQNVVYTGRIAMRAWQNEPERIVPGLHVAIVDDALFARVQAARFETGRKGHGTRRPSLPPPELVLRGHVACPDCGRPMTGSVSRGNGGQYGYYSCFNGTAKDGHGRFRSDVVLDRFESALAGLTVGREVRRLMRAVLRDLAGEKASGKEREIGRLRAVQCDLEKKLFKVDEKYALGELPADAYRRLRAQYDADGATLATKLACIERQAPVAEAVEFALSLFENLLGAWRRMDVAGRRHVLGSIWPSKLVFDGEGFGTSLESPLVALFRGKEAEKTEAAPLFRGRLPAGLPG